MFKRLDHVGVVVDDLEEAQAFLAQLELSAVRNLVIPGRLRAAFYQCGETQIEVIEITDEKERSQRLGDEKARIEHVAMEVEDLDTTARALRGLGVAFTGEPMRLGDTLSSWTVADTCDGVMYQLIQKNLT